MHSFFLVRAKMGDLRAQLLELQARFESLLAYATEPLHRHHAISKSGRIAVFAFSNEPLFHLYKAASGALAVVSGHTTHGPALLSAGAKLALGDQVRQTPGRFSALVFEPQFDRAAVANSVVRVDPVFLGENAEFEVLGTQASALAQFLHGEHRFDPQALFSFLNAGFFGSDETAFFGVRCLPAASTWLVEDAKSKIHTLHPAARKLAHPKVGQKEMVAKLAQELKSAFGQLQFHRGPLVIGLTGGMDSRLLLAAASNAGLDIRARTTCKGEWALPDVYVASLLCERLGIAHKVEHQQAVREVGARQELHLDYLKRAANALKASDGTISAWETLSPARGAFESWGALIGLGGEVLRAGFAEKRKPLSWEQARTAVFNKFARFGELFEAAARERYVEQMNAWLTPFASHGLEGREVLDSLYADFRCGRWIGGTSQATNHYKWLPLLDNRWCNTLVAMPAKDKNHSQLHQALLNELCPELADIPLSNKFWPSTSRLRRLWIRRRFPRAFTEPRAVAATSDWRKAFPQVLAEHMRDYCVRDGRIDALRGTLQLDRVSALFDAGTPEFKKRPILIHAVYAACVLLSGDWLKAPNLSQPLVGAY